MCNKLKNLIKEQAALLRENAAFVTYGLIFLMMGAKRVNLQQTEICTLEQLLSYVIEYKRTEDLEKFNTRLADLSIKELMEIYHTIDPIGQQIGDDTFDKLVTK